MKMLEVFGSTPVYGISGYAFMLNRNSPLISWKSRKQNTVALSSCEAEYIAITASVQECMFLRQLLFDMTKLDKVLGMLYVDNQGAIELAKNPRHHQRTKHIDIRFHFIRLEIKHKTVILEYVPSILNIADIFTKPFNGAKLNHFKFIFGV